MDKRTHSSNAEKNKPSCPCGFWHIAELTSSVTHGIIKSMDKDITFEEQEHIEALIDAEIESDTRTEELWLAR